MVSCNGNIVVGIKSKKNAAAEFIKEQGLNPDFFSRGNKKEAPASNPFKKVEYKIIRNLDSDMVDYNPNFFTMLKN